MTNDDIKVSQERDSSEEFARKYPHHHIPFYNRPFHTRRGFFKLAAAGLTGSYLLPTRASAANIVTSGVTTQNTAKNVIYIHLIGAISHTDTFDLKVVNGATPASFNPTMLNGLNWPMGLLPKLGGHIGDIAVARMSAWALVHSLAQTWTQIGRNPAAALGDIAPNVGSVVAIEKEKDRKPGQVFPAFLALNSGNPAGQGYFKASYAPFLVTPRAGANSIANTANANGQSLFNTMFGRLGQYDGALRAAAPYGGALSDMDSLYGSARGMMYNPTVDAAFSISTTDSIRYGNGTAASNFGNACLVAKQVLAADQGTRFIQIDFGSWDHHQDIYGVQNPNGNNLMTMGPQLDNGLGALIDDLKAAGQFDNTLIIVQGEFGRTVGPVTAAGGRDHFLIQSAMFAGGGVKGGKAVGATNSTGTSPYPGGIITDFGWAGSGTGPRVIRPEDIESTLYSAMGIDWTTIRYDDPFGRGFEYVPFAKVGQYGPINELFK
ncbi:MAG: DUF1501 domain-containing protein [Acidobacteriota bacterium]